jgi:hypothetical protein
VDWQYQISSFRDERYGWTATASPLFVYFTHAEQRTSKNLNTDPEKIVLQ